MGVGERKELTQSCTVASGVDVRKTPAISNTGGVFWSVCLFSVRRVYVKYTNDVVKAKERSISKRSDLLTYSQEV